MNASELRELIQKTKKASDDYVAERSGVTLSEVSYLKGLLADAILTTPGVVKAYEAIERVGPMLRDHARLADGVGRQDRLAAGAKAVENVKVLTTRPACCLKPKHVCTKENPLPAGSKNMCVTCPDARVIGRGPQGEPIWKCPHCTKTFMNGRTLNLAEGAP